MFEPFSYKSLESWMNRVHLQVDLGIAKDTTGADRAIENMARRRVYKLLEEDVVRSRILPEHLQICTFLLQPWRSFRRICGCQR